MSLRKTRKGNQKQRLAKALQAISADVTTEDRQFLNKEKGYSITLISNYLNGKVYSADTAADMLKCLKERIADREELINS